MTEQRFDIIVQDKVAPTIKTELAAIGTSARTTQGFIRSLKAEMSSLSSGAGGLGSTVSATTRALREEAAAANAVRSALASQRAEVDALTRSLEAQTRAARSAASARGGAGTSAGGGAQPFGPPAPTNARTNTGSAATNTPNAARSIREVGEASRLSSQYTAQLGFQLNDIFVSLASGQKPMTVFIQQGAQIAQIPAQAGMSWKQFGSAALNTLGVVKRTGDAALDAAAAQATAAAAAVAAANSSAASNVRVAETELALATAQREAAATANAQAAASLRLTAANEALAAANAEAAITAQALATAEGEAATASTAASGASATRLSGLAKGGIAAVVAITALVLSVGALNHEANNDSGLKKYTKEMGFTTKEVEKLNAMTVSWGDTAKAVFQVGAARVASAFGLSSNFISKAWKSTMDFLASAARTTIAFLYSAFTASGYAIARIMDNMKKGTFENPLTTMVESYKSAYKDANKFMDDVVSQSKKNARERQDKLAAELVSPSHAKKGPKPWDRAQQLKNDNAELDAQIALLSKYGDELERANMLEQISKKFRDHNVPLTQAETAALEAKIAALQEGRRVQEAMTAADEAANGAGRKFEATTEALDKLLAKGAITQQQYTEQLRLASRAFEDVTDPLAALNRELQRNGELMGLYGRDKDVAAYIQQLQQAAEAQGKSIYQGANKQPSIGPNGEIIAYGRSNKLNPDAQGMVDQFQQQQQQQQYGQYFQQNDPQQKYQDPNSDTYVLDHQKELYAEIQRLRDQDVISEQEANERRKNLDRDYKDTKLELTGGMFGQLAGLQTSHNRTIAALGKAAAIAQATIDGYRAVQAALIGPPGPPWSFAIAGVTAAMTAANVAKIAGIGFMDGGYTGNMATNQVAGAVHGQEYVFDASATKRIGVPALEAMRKGSALSMPSNDNSRRGANISITQGPGTFVEAVERSDGEIEIIAERVARKVAPGAVADDIHRSPNSRTASALKTNYGLARNR